MDLLGGERDTTLDAQRQMRSTDVSGKRCGICSLIGLHHTNPHTSPQVPAILHPCQYSNGVGQTNPSGGPPAVTSP